MRALSAFILVVLLLFYPAVPAAAQADSATRADFVLALWTAFGAVPYEDTARFSDVPHNRPYTAAICWAADLNLVRG
ncbi:MAG: S-layer homology domain-containing protein, partial [Pseudoflavonifractor sp.]